MAVNSLNRKNFEKVKKTSGKKFKEQLKKFSEQPSDTFVSEEEKKNNVLDIYQQMSPSEKAAFNKEIEKKKIRDNRF